MALYRQKINCAVFMNLGAQIFSGAQIFFSKGHNILSLRSSEMKRLCFIHRLCKYQLSNCNLNAVLKLLYSVFFFFSFCSLLSFCLMSLTIFVLQILFLCMEV